MSTLSIEGWCKVSSEQHPSRVEDIHFYLNGNDHLNLERAEEYLQRTQEEDVMVDVNPDTLKLSLPKEHEPLSDCKLRVYLNPDTQRGQFHLVGHRASDGSLIYSNAVLIDQLIQ